MYFGKIFQQQIHDGWAEEENQPEKVIMTVFMGFHNERYLIHALTNTWSNYREKKKDTTTNTLYEVHCCIVNKRIVRYIVHAKSSFTILSTHTHSTLYQ